MDDRARRYAQAQTLGKPVAWLLLLVWVFALLRALFMSVPVGQVDNVALQLIAGIVLIPILWKHGCYRLSSRAAPTPRS